MTLTADELKAAHFSEIKHYNYERGYGYDYACDLAPAVVVKIRRITKADPEHRVIVVGEREFVEGDWEGAAQALAELGDKA